MAEELDNQEIEILSLRDEDGNDRDFEIVDQLEYEGETYYALQEYFDNVEDLDKQDTDRDIEILILKSAMEGDDEMLVRIDDDDTYDKIVAMFDARMDEEEEDEEE